MNLMIPKREIMKLSFLSVIILSILLVSVSCAESSSEPKLNITVSPTSYKVNIDDSISFDVVINTEVLSRGAQWTLTYDPNVILCTGITEGTFYKDWAEANGCTTVVIPEPVIDNENGCISVTGVAVWGATEGGVTGKGVLFTYHFRAVASGVAAPTLSDIVISDESCNSLQVQ